MLYLAAPPDSSQQRTRKDTILICKLSRRSNSNSNLNFPRNRYGCIPILILSRPDTEGTEGTGTDGTFLEHPPRPSLPHACSGLITETLTSADRGEIRMAAGTPRALRCGSISCARNH